MEIINSKASQKITLLKSPLGKSDERAGKVRSSAEEETAPREASCLSGTLESPLVGSYHHRAPRSLKSV